MEHIKVSVIVPVYNTGPFLEECLDSLCRQTLKEIEIICVNDSSTDNSAEILEQYAERDDRIKVIYNEHTGYGAASARNRGLEDARGEYLSFLDSDDYFDLSMLEKAYTKAAALHADIVMYDAQRFKDQTGEYVPTEDVLRAEYIPKKEVFSGRDFPDEIYLSTIGAAWCMLVRHEHVVKHHLYFQSLYHADDFFFTYSAMSCAERMTAIHEKLLFYRVANQKSQSATKSIAPLAAIEACGKLKSWLEEKGLYPLYRKGFINVTARYFEYYVNTLDYEGFAVLYDAIKNQYIQEFELDTLKEDEYLRHRLYYWVQDIKQYNREEYLFKRLNPGGGTVFSYATDKIFPIHLISREEKVILYGAGNIGKAYYIQNIIHGYCNVAGWVDKNADQLYAPVERIDVIKTRPYDKILVAIESPKIVKEVKDSLLAMGVDEKKIVSNAALEK